MSQHGDGVGHRTPTPLRWSSQTNNVTPVKHQGAASDCEFRSLGIVGDTGAGVWHPHEQLLAAFASVEVPAGCWQQVR